MKHIKTFESYVNEGAVKAFEMDMEELISNIKRGMGWIDPEYVEDTWNNMKLDTPFNKVEDEVLYRLIDADMLYFANDNDPERKGKKVTKAEIGKINKY